MAVSQRKEEPANTIKTQQCNIWWANHGRTFSKAKDGGYLWVPIPVKGGNTFPHWESMNYVVPGDLILNFSNGNIVAFGIAKAKARKHIGETAGKKTPGKEGLRVDLAFYDLVSPVSMDEIKPFLELINQSIAENRPFNEFHGVNNGFLFNFSTKGIQLIAEKFTDRIPEKILNYLDSIVETDFSVYLKKQGLVFDNSRIKKYILSLHTSPFVLVSGNPGVGKKKLALNYARYVDEKYREKAEEKKDASLFKRRWFKLSYNDKEVINAFTGFKRKIDQLRITMLNNGLVPLGWDNRDLNQKKVIKEILKGDVIIAYQGAYMVGGIGIVTQPHFFDESGDAYDTFCESSKNFIRVEWLFSGPLKIKDFTFQDYDMPGFGMWVDTVHEMTRTQALEFADYLETKNISLSAKKTAVFPKTYELVPVGTHWKGKRDLLGCFDNSTKEYLTTRALELILNANTALASGLKNPFFLILDGMKLSMAEDYLSDILSVFGSDQTISLHNSDDVEQDAGIPKELSLPSNLFITGIVSTDKNRHQPSLRVLDRANVIHFAPLAIRDYLTKTDQRSFETDLPFPERNEANRMTMAEILEKTAAVVTNDEAGCKMNEKIICEIGLFQKVLENTGFDLGYRVIHDILRYLMIVWTFEDQPQRWDGWKEVLDAQLMQRVLPKLSGKEKRMKDLLKCLYCCCFSDKTSIRRQTLERGKSVDELFSMEWEDALYKGTAKKIKLMQHQLEARGHVSFF